MWTELHITRVCATSTDCTLLDSLTDHTFCHWRMVSFTYHCSSFQRCRWQAARQGNALSFIGATTRCTELHPSTIETEREDQANPLASGTCLDQAMQPVGFFVNAWTLDRQSAEAYDTVSYWGNYAMHWTSPPNNWDQATQSVWFCKRLDKQSEDAYDTVFYWETTQSMYWT